MKMLNKMKLFAAAVICLNLGGCATQLALSAFQQTQSAATNAYLERMANSQNSQHYGTKIDPAAVSQIKKGVTARSQIEILFGQPQRVIMSGDGKRMMFYSYYSASERHTLQIVLDSANVVQDYEYQ